MVRAVLGLKFPEAPGSVVAIHHGYVQPATVREFSSSSMGGGTGPHHGHQPQRNDRTTGGCSDPAGVGRGACNSESRGSSSISAGVLKTANVGSEMPKSAQTSAGAKPRKGSFGGAGSAFQKSSQFSPQAPSFQFGTVGLDDSTPSVVNGLSDNFPKLFDNNVDIADVSTHQTASPGWSKKPVGNGLQSAQSSESKKPVGNGLQSAQSSESKASPPPVEGMSVIVPNGKSEVMQPKRPGERQSDGSERLSSGGGEGSSRDGFPASPPPPSLDESQFPALGASSAVAGNRKPWRKGGGGGGGRGRVEQAQAQAPLPSEHVEPKQRDQANSPTSMQAGRERPSDSDLNRYYEKRRADQQGAEADSPTSMQAGRERPSESDLNRYYEKRRADRQGAELGNGLETGDRRDGRRSSSSQGRDAAWEKAKSIDALGKTLSRILRHQAGQLNLEMSSDGYVDVQDLLKLSMKTWANRPLLSHTVDDVKQAVQQDKKQRFGMNEKNGRLFIRANQGHTIKSVKSELLLKPIVSAAEIPVCVHGTYREFLDQIFKEGLKTMGRNHVHFAAGVVRSEGVISGMRSSCEVLIHLDVVKALADGMRLYISENKVILTEGFEGVVPPEYFKEVVGFPDLKPIPMPARGFCKWSVQSDEHRQKLPLGEPIFGPGG